MNTLHISFKELFSNCFLTVGVITFNGDAGERLGVLVSSFTSLSLDPLLISFNLSPHSYISEKFKSVNSFNLNILSKEQENIARQFSKPREVKWDIISHEFSPSHPPILLNTLGVLNAKVRQKFLCGDHDIIIGEVEKITVNPLLQPLTYYKREYNNFFTKFS